MVPEGPAADSTDKEKSHVAVCARLSQTLDDCSSRPLCIAKKRAAVLDSTYNKTKTVQFDLNPGANFNPPTEMPTGVFSSQMIVTTR
jgi:hypothetical protein